LINILGFTLLNNSAKGGITAKRYLTW